MLETVRLVVPTGELLPKPPLQADLLCSAVLYGRTMDVMNGRKTLVEVLELVDRWGELYDRCWGKRPPYLEQPEVRPEVDALIDQVRTRTRLARDVVDAMGEPDIAERIVEYEEGVNGGHPFSQARVAIVEATAILTNRDDLAKIVGPVGPRLAATHLHPAIWGAAARLWDDGHLRASVQTAAAALEGLLQATAGPGVAGEALAALFSVSEPRVDDKRLRIRGVATESRTWKSAHEGAVALVRGVFLGVRNLVSHPGWPDPSADEALEMLATLSYVAHLVDRSDVVTAE